MVLILAFDTSDAACAVGIFDGDTVLDERSEQMRRGHAERLFPMIAAALEAARLRPDDLSAVAVVTGPGGFTGGRVGVAAARGLAVSLGVPAIGVDWFAALGRRAQRARVVLPGAGGAWLAQRFAAGAALGPIETVAEGGAASDDETIFDAQTRTRIGLVAIAAAAGELIRREAPMRPTPLYLRAPDAVAAGKSVAATALRA